MERKKYAHYGKELTDAVCCCVAAAANLATWFIIGEKLVGPYNFTWGRQARYASTMPWIPREHK